MTPRREAARQLRAGVPGGALRTTVEEALGCLLLLAACDGAARRVSADSGPPDAPAHAAQVIARLAQAACVAISRCGEGAIVEMRSFAGTGQVCQRRMERRLAVGYRTELALAAAGRVRADESRLERCLDSIRTTCTPVSVLFSGGVCTRLFAGTTPAGGACADTLECAADGWCEVSPDALDGCGRCRVARPLGQPCTLDHECSRSQAPSGVICASAAGFRCTRVEIEAEVTAGMSCGRRLNSEPAIRVAACAPAFWCDVLDEGTGVCRSRVPRGGACELGRSVCDDALRCPEVTSTCQPVSIADDAGQPCGPDAICNHYEGLVCLQGTCRRLGQAGGACGDDSDCDFGLFCEQGTLSCQSPRPEDRSCQVDSDCIDEHCAFWPGATIGTCQALICR